MVNSCCAVDCKNRVGSSSCGRKITFHRFPAESMRRLTWIKAVNRYDPYEKKLWIPSKTAVLCSEHFELDDFHCYRGATVLKKEAVPSKFSGIKRKVTKTFSSSSSTSSTAETDPAPVASSSTILPPVEPAFIFKEHSYALLSSIQTLKRNSEELEDKLVKTQQALYNAERRESRARSKLQQILHELEKERVITSQARLLLKVYENIPSDVLRKTRSKIQKKNRIGSQHRISIVQKRMHVVKMSN